MYGYKLLIINYLCFSIVYPQNSGESGITNISKNQISIKNLIISILYYQYQAVAVLDTARKASQHVV